jgi:hypothetical protein
MIFRRQRRVARIQIAFSAAHGSLVVSPVDAASRTRAALADFLGRYAVAT